MNQNIPEENSRLNKLDEDAEKILSVGQAVSYIDSNK